jgi:hypothetical protein
MPLPTARSCDTDNARVETLHMDTLHIWIKLRPKMTASLACRMELRIWGLTILTLRLVLDEPACG